MFEKNAFFEMSKGRNVIKQPSHKLTFIAGIAVVPLFATSMTFVKAQETPVLPDAIPPAPSTSSTAVATNASPAATKDELPVVEIRSPVPSYLDRGVTMVPLRPVANFLGVKVASQDGVLTLSQRSPQTNSFIVATIRQGGKTAQIVSSTGSRSLPVQLPVETRLGNTFIPLRFLVQAFGASISFRVPDNAVVLSTPTAIGVLTPSNPHEYSGKSAAIVTISNKIGRPLSLRLTGPQTVALELGHGQSFTRRMAPGVYYYKAVSAGMRPRSGARRLVAGRKVSWSWGRR